MTKIEELKQAAQDAEDALAQAWVNLRDWMKLNRLNVSPQRAHVIGQSKEVDQVVGHWTEWHMMSYDPGLHCSDGIKLVRAIADAGLVLENADRDVHDYSVYHVFTRSIGAMMSGTGAVQRSNRTYDALPRAVFDLRQEMLCGSHVEHGVAVAYIWHGSKNFGFDDDGELFGDEPDATLVISDALIKRNYKFHDITITGVMQNPFIEVTCAR